MVTWKKKLTKNARALRRDLTDAERKLWYGLRDRRLKGRKFRRQYALGGYVVDFVCLEEMIIVEVDGSQHADTAAEDAVRSSWLEGQGFRVMRFWNNDVLKNIVGVLTQISASFSPHPAPLPQAGEGAPTNQRKSHFLAFVHQSHNTIKKDLPHA